MRVTSAMLTDRLVADLRATNAQIRRWQERAATGRAINRPSDDPVGTVQALRARSTLGRIERYQRSVEDARNWLEVSESALTKASDLVQRARELAVAGANGTLPDASYVGLALEVEQLLAELVNTANATYDGRFVFSGHQTLTPPFAISGPPYAVTYQGDGGTIYRPVADQKTLAANVPGNAAFSDAFSALIGLHSNLAAADPDAVGQDLAALDAALDALLGVRAEVGGRINRAELAAGRLDQEWLGLQTVVARVEGADLARVALELATHHVRLEASLAAGARIIQPSLLNFLV